MKFPSLLVITTIAVITPATVSPSALAGYPASCAMSRHEDTAQCFMCKVIYKNKSLNSITDLNYNKVYHIEAGKGGWEVDQRDTSCLVNDKTGQKYCNIRC